MKIGNKKDNEKSKTNNNNGTPNIFKKGILNALFILKLKLKIILKIKLIKRLNNIDVININIDNIICSK